MSNIEKSLEELCDEVCVPVALFAFEDCEDIDGCLKRLAECDFGRISSEASLLVLALVDETADSEDISNRLDTLMKDCSRLMPELFLCTVGEEDFEVIDSLACSDLGPISREASSLYADGIRRASQEVKGE